MKLPERVYWVFTLIILAGTAAPSFAQVDRDELQDLPPVVFINYEGPHARIDTREQIRQLGVVLGRQISARNSEIAPRLAAMPVEQRREYSYRFETGALSRYFIIHVMSAQDGNKIDADIFGVGVDAGVDHVRNLRTIIQGYLQNAYDYSERDAAVLAEYITIYNAVYRGNWDYFTERYKNQVISHLSRERTGLSIRYDEWPGRTLILIPLGHGGISAVDTTTISDRRVVEELRREDDFGVSQRQDMVDLKEREADDAERRAQTEREVIRREEREIDRERQEIAQERQRVEDDQQITDDDRKEIQEELDRREEIADERDRELEERREEVERLDEFAERKIDEAQAEREEIARDQQAAITQDATGGVIGMTIERQTPTVMGRLVRINTASGRELRRSPLDSVHIRTITFVGGKIIAIAGENRGNGAVRLIEINQDNLEMAKQGDDDINIGSLIWVNGNDLYAITIDLATNTCFLGRFNTNLALQAKSAVKIHSDASVTIQQGRLLTQREDGTALILNPMDLTELR